MAVLLAPGTTAANSASFTLADGESATLCLAPAQSGELGNDAAVDIQMQSNGEWVTIGGLNAARVGATAAVVQAPGTFRVARVARKHPVGVEKV